ncbi:DEAD/DEAH box helicase family protein [Arthrobacter sp. NPDC056727]|uniref:DEAD/DEAH box helicase family protein n=1 Tax=Arthrobacter sp. NPDC056727 TaxID=3345927 RepID=UPI00366AF12D
MNRNAPLPFAYERTNCEKEGLPEFDLIVCDEAHRTTGITEASHDDSAFVKVHDNTYIESGKRLYMTATPRIYVLVPRAARNASSSGSPTYRERNRLPSSRCLRL